MKRAFATLSLTLAAALCAPAMNAACGGGGYKPPQAQASASPAPTAVAYQNNTNYSNNNYNSGYSNNNTYAGNNNFSSASSNFDASYFHRISGKLRLNYDQSTKIINALNEIRHDMDSGKKIEPKQAFEARLAQILDAQQMNDYKSMATKS